MQPMPRLGDTDMGVASIDNGSSAIPVTVNMALARLKHEQAARKVAEQFAESKNRELSIALKAQEQLLRGGVKLMTDILATARPEVFQKAAKVQRWTRQISRHMTIDKAWELDLAALLYPMGVISLPDDLAAKYAADIALDEEEALLIEESALVASRLIANIPRMDGVARAVFYARKGYDGSGWPADGPSGNELPQAARILKVLIDLADAATGASRTRDDAFRKLAHSHARYDPEIFAVARTVLMVIEPTPSEGMVSIRPMLARTGDVLVKDLTDQDGRLLLSAGTELTELSAHRLLSLAQSHALPASILVLRNTKSSNVSEDLPSEELF